MGSRPKLLELRPESSLLNSDFDGYKLSLEQISTITETLKVPVNRLTADVNHYSLLHAKLYALHNHLLGEVDEIGESESVYFIDRDLNIHRFSIVEELNKFSDTTVWNVPLQRERISGDYNLSMKFANKQLAVVADGQGYLYVLDRGSNDRWSEIFSGEVAGPDQNFIISDVVYKDTDKPELHFLLVSIRQSDSNKQNSTILHWITLLKTDSWNQVALRELTVPGFVQYAHLERTCEAVYVVSDAGCKFTLDSEKEIRKTEEEAPVKRYTWTQSREDITVKIPLPVDATGNTVQVKTENCKIEIKNQQEILLEGTLFQRIDPTITSWTVENHVLEVTLEKLENGLMWPELIVGDRSGEHIPDPALVEQVAERLAPLTSDTEIAPPAGTTFNSQQVEECDFESDKMTAFERLNCNSHEITHKVNLGSYQVLFSLELDKNVPPAFAVRYDVDACVWQPAIQSDDFQIVHAGTLYALGYIQASKQQRKFFTSSPDMSFSAISESSKHVFLYFQNKKITSNELRNRTTGRRVNTLAQQQVYSLPSNDEILGLFASYSYLYVLGETFLTALKL